MKLFSRIQFIIGIWILISPWVLGYADFAPILWSNIIIGVATALLGMWGIFGGDTDSSNKN